MKKIGLLLWLAVLGGRAWAGEVRVAVAANFTAPAQEIAARFAAATGDKVDLSFGSSGEFVAQIAHGAPYDALLSADVDHVRKAAQAGFAVPGSDFTYAVGHLVLWSATPGLVDPGGRVLVRGGFAHVAIADPALAPYGLAAEQYLESAGLWGRLGAKLVRGKSIAQAYEFVKTGNAELGFVALSQVIGKPDGSEWRVPDGSHAPIIQQAVLLKQGAGNPAARAFLDFLRSPAAKAIIARYGYD